VEGDAIQTASLNITGRLIFLMIESGPREDNGDSRPLPSTPTGLMTPTGPRNISPWTTYQRPQNGGTRRDGARQKTPYSGQRRSPPLPPPPPLLPPQALPKGGLRDSARSSATPTQNVVRELAGALNKNESRSPAENDALLKLYEEVIGQREQLQAQRRDYGTRRQEFMKLARSFIQLRSSRATTSRRSRTSSAGSWDDMQRVLGDMNDLQHICEKIEKRLEHMEQKLKQTEARYHAQLSKTVPTSPPFNTTPNHTVELLAGDSDSESTTESSHNPLVDRYYDRIGDIHLLRERMYNFEAEHRRQLAVRAVLWRNRQILEPPDPVFYERYFKRRGDFIREYSAASQEVEQLSLICQEQGLEIEDANLPPFSEAQALDRTLRDQQSISFVNPASADGNTSISIQRLAEDIDTKARIAVWLSDMRKEEPEQLSHPLCSETDQIKSASSPSISEVLDNPEPPQDLVSGQSPTSRPFASSSPLQIMQTSNSDNGFNKLEEDNASTSITGSKKRFSDFQADPPRRRYSEPFLPLVRFSHKATSGFDILCKSYQEVRNPKSVC
jgi:hypothetical protein